MDTKSDDQFIAIEARLGATIEANKQDSDKKHNETNESIKLLTETLNKVLKGQPDQNNISKSSPAQKDTMTLPDPTTAVHTIKKASTLEGEISENIGGMWTLKHEISSQKIYELLIKTELKGDTALDLKNFFNHIKMSLNVVNRLREDLLPDYQSIKRNFQFE